jgi:hypothetical protein
MPFAKLSFLLATSRRKIDVFGPQQHAAKQTQPPGRPGGPETGSDGDGAYGLINSTLAKVTAGPP